MLLTDSKSKISDCLYYAEDDTENLGLSVRFAVRPSYFQTCVSILTSTAVADSFILSHHHCLDIHFAVTFWKARYVPCSVGVVAKRSTGQVTQVDGANQTGPRALVHTPGLLPQHHLGISDPEPVHQRGLSTRLCLAASARRYCIWSLFCSCTQEGPRMSGCAPTSG